MRAPVKMCIRDSQILHEHVVARHVGVHGAEPLGRVHETDEEQAGVEATRRVVAVDEVVAATKHRDSAVVLWADPSHVRPGIDQRLSVGAGRGEVDRAELVASGQRRARGLLPSEDAILLLQLDAVPGLDQHRDPPGDQVGAPA